jgi:hypothetical protein
MSLKQFFFEKKNQKTFVTGFYLAGSALPAAHKKTRLRVHATGLSKVCRAASWASSARPAR